MKKKILTRIETWPSWKKILLAAVIGGIVAASIPYIGATVVVLLVEAWSCIGGGFCNFG